MKKIAIVLLMASALGLITACQPKACPEDAKVCPDGTTVGREGPNCEFPECPGGDAQLPNPASVFCEEQGGKVEIVNEAGGQRGICVLADGTRCDEWAYFRGECPECGECPQLSPAPPHCPDGVVVPGGKDKCGCTLPAQCVEKNVCTAESREVEFCTKEYRPVCGWFNESIKCIAYPCAITASNPCEACHNPQVEYWTEGECPEVSK